jgi:hypothetical protein
MDIRLQDYMPSCCGWGQLQGRKTRKLLQTHLQAHPGERIIRISLAGIHQADVTFAREAIVELAWSERGRRGFCLIDVGHPDLLENWDAAAGIREQPLLLWQTETAYQILGPKPALGLRAMLAFVLAVPVARTQEAAAALHLKVPNASNKLRELWAAGYILRREQSADSGGLEFEYFRIA